MLWLGMAQHKCSCCSRAVPAAQLRHHAVGGGVREENELLCADCWVVFASEAWEEASGPLSGDVRPGGNNSSAQSELACMVQQITGRACRAAAAQNGSSPQAGTAQGKPAAADEDAPAMESRAQSLANIQRLSGGGGWQRPEARPEEAAQKEGGTPLHPVTEGACAPAAAQGKALKRDRHGRFVSSKPSAAAAADHDDPLLQDLMASQAHLFEQQQQQQQQQQQAPPLPPPQQQQRDQQQQQQPEEHAFKAPPAACAPSPAGSMKCESMADMDPGSPGERIASTASLVGEEAAHLRTALERASRQRALALEQCAQLQSQVASLETCLRSARLLVQCTACKSERRSAAALPCGHLLYCAACMDAQRAGAGSCGKCAGAIEGVLRLSLS